MNKSSLLLVLFVIGSGSAFPQSSNAYVFFGPGGVTAFRQTSGSLYMGGGGEVILWKIVGAGPEIGAMTSTDFRTPIGLGSANGYAHFTTNRRPTFDPFVTAGYTILFRSGHANLFNFGGGVNWWFRDHAGVRAEFRDHVWRSSPVTIHYWAFRFGFAFR